jgi:hypothetical protein
MRTSPDARENSNVALATSVLRQGGTIFLKAWGTSMLPSVWPGDVLTIRSIASTEISPGDIVLVLDRDRLVIHRLLGRHMDPSLQAWMTKGDSMPDDDPPTSHFALLGRVVSIRRGARELTPGRKVSRVQALIASRASASNRFRSILLRLHAWRVHSASLSDTFAAPFRSIRLGSDDCY